MKKIKTSISRDDKVKEVLSAYNQEIPANIENLLVRARVPGPPSITFAPFFIPN